MCLLNKHDRYVQELLDKVASRYDIIYTEFPLFSGKKRKVAEVDVMGVAGDRIDVFEVKCSHRIVKATKQLKKIKTHLRPDVHQKYIHTFFYCGATGAITLIN